MATVLLFTRQDRWTPPNPHRSVFHGVVYGVIPVIGFWMLVIWWVTR